MARKRKRDALQPSVDLPLRDNNTKDVADMRVTRAKSRRLQPKTAITDLPVDVLISIFSRLPNENALLGAVAKVNREFRDIATDDQVRGAVRLRFLIGHAIECQDCLHYAESIQHFRQHEEPIETCAEDPDNYSTDHEYHPAEDFFWTLDLSHDCMMFFLLATDRKVLTSTGSVIDELMDVVVLQRHFRILRYLVEECNIGDITTVSLEKCAFRSVGGNGRGLSYDIIRYIVEELGLGSDWDARVKLLRNAISGGYLGAVRYFVQEGRDGRKLMYACADNGATALHTAAETGKLEIVRYLVEDQGAEDMVFMKDRDGDTPLMLAVSEGNKDVVLYFLENFKTSNP
eukprot:Rmarinus@m.18747